MTMLRMSGPCLPLALAIMGCSPEAGADTPADVTATLPEKAAETEQAALAERRSKLRAELIALCKQGNLPGAEGEVGTDENCNEAYDKGVRAQGAAAAIISAFGPNGAAKAVSLNDIRTRLPQINWTDELAGGSTIASGKLGDFAALVTQRNNRQYLSMSWTGEAGKVPVDVGYAMLLDGAKLDLVACNSGALDETGRMWRVTPAHGDPFDLQIYTRVGPSGSAVSSHLATAALDGNRATLESLRAEDPDWNVCG